MKELEAIIYELIILRSKLDKLCTNLKFIFLFLPSTGVPLRFQLLGYLLYPPYGVCAGPGKPQDGFLWCKEGGSHHSSESYFWIVLPMYRAFLHSLLWSSLRSCFHLNSENFKAQKYFKVGSGYSKENKAGRTQVFHVQGQCCFHSSRMEGSWGREEVLTQRTNQEQCALMGQGTEPAPGSACPGDEPCPPYSQSK